jgi:SAM-dependent methyltransferase
MDIAQNLQPGAFEGTAETYLRYRPPYPVPMLDELLGRAKPAPGAVLLDLACGPGRVALDLAGAFGRVLAVDLEPEMVEVGRVAAARRGIGNVTWMVGRAEEAQIEAGSVDLITVGEAFHRLEQTVVAAKAFGWLKPGGCFATLGARSLLDGDEPWQRTAAKVARRWMARAFPTGWAPGRPDADLGPGGFERVLRAAGFVDVENRDFEQPRDWSFEEIVGYLRSTSTCSLKALGEHGRSFEAGLRAALVGDVFSESFSSGYTLGRKPG